MIRMIDMARSPRICAPDSVYHVMARGNGGQPIVARRADWKRLLDVIARVKASSDFKLYAYCLMTNHFHALIRVGVDPLAHFMQRIQTAWAIRFNLAGERRGHVFQGRFKSKWCKDDTNYCRWLLRYIHVNPVNAGIVERPQDWPWSSYRQFLGLESGIADIDWPLSLFDKGLPSFVDFVMQGIGDGTLPEEMEDGKVAGGAYEPESRGPAEPARLEALAERTARESGIDAAALFGPGRARSVCAARRRLVVRAIACGYRGSELARRFGVTTTAISRMLHAKDVLADSRK